MRILAPGLLQSEGAGDEPTRCSEIGCPCVIPKQLVDVRQGQTLVFFCPSSRIAATLSPAMHGVLIVGGHYTGTET